MIGFRVVMGSGRGREEHGGQKGAVCRPEEGEAGQTGGTGGRPVEGGWGIETEHRAQWACRAMGPMEGL